MREIIAAHHTGTPDQQAWSHITYVPSCRTARRQKLLHRRRNAILTAHCECVLVTCTNLVIRHVISFVLLKQHCTTRARCGMGEGVTFPPMSSALTVGLWLGNMEFVCHQSGSLRWTQRHLYSSPRSGLSTHLVFLIGANWLTARSWQRGRSVKPALQQQQRKQ